MEYYLYKDKDRKDGRSVIKILKPWYVCQIDESQAVDTLQNFRIAAIKEMESMQTQQKTCAEAKIFDAARIYADLSKAALKRLRAIRLWLGYFGCEDKDCPWVEFWYWPTGLAEEVHDVARDLYLAVTK